MIISKMNLNQQPSNEKMKDGANKSDYNYSETNEIR